MVDEAGAGVEFGKVDDGGEDAEGEADEERRVADEAWEVGEKGGGIGHVGDEGAGGVVEGCEFER